MKFLIKAFLICSILTFSGCKLDIHLPQEEPKTPQETKEENWWLKTDLTNCISYYDGCNTCMVENGEVTACTRMACIQGPSESNPVKCLKYKGEDKTNCEEAGGNYLEGSNECEGISKEQCESSLKGNFQECASACRNNPEAEICTLQCVQVCEL